MSRRRVVNRIQVVETASPRGTVRGTTVRCKTPDGCVLEEFRGDGAWDRAVEWATRTLDFKKGAKQ